MNNQLSKVELNAVLWWMSPMGWPAEERSRRWSQVADWCHGAAYASHSTESAQYAFLTSIAFCRSLMETE